MPSKVGQSGPCRVVVALVFAALGVAGLGLTWLGPVVGALTTAGFVAAIVICMLLERRDLRDRLIGLIGHGQLATTTKAFDEAGSRVSRQLLIQSLVSLLYGIAFFVGLYFLHVPYPLVWATLGAAFRFIPYLERATARKDDYPGAALYYTISVDGGRTFAANRKIKDHTCECYRLAIDFERNDAPIMVWRDVIDGTVRDHGIVPFTGPTVPGTPRRATAIFRTIFA